MIHRDFHWHGFERENNNDRMIKLKSDFHLHTCDDRMDAIGHTAHALISTAARKGFKVLSITNHDTFTYSYELERYAADQGVLLIPGIEKTVEGKHTLILNADWAAEKIKTFGDLRRARRDGIFVIAPHPFFRTDFCLAEKLLEHVELFDAVEVSYFYTRWMNFNRKAVRLAKEKGLPLVGNSDCHILKYMGMCHSIIHAEKQTAEAVFAAIRNHHVEVVSRPIFLPKLARIYFEIRTIGRKNQTEKASEQEEIMGEKF
jgi:predicted metal-dependent phosphoesterase TrpH